MRPPSRYAFIDPLDLPRLKLAGLHDGTNDGVMLEAGAEPRQFQRQPPEFHDDPDGAALFGGFQDQTVTYPPAFLTSTRDSRLAGYRMTLTNDGRCFHDESLSTEARSAYLDRLAEPAAFPNEETGLRRTAAPREFRLAAAGRPQTQLDGSVVVLCSNEPHNFGSFLFRVLPKLHAVRRFGLGHLPVLVHASSDTELQHLVHAGVAPSLIRRHDTRRLYRIGHAIRPCLRNDQAYLDPESRTVFDDLVARYGGNQGPRRIYVSRLAHAQRGASSRVMTNEAALITRLRRMGFAIIEPESLSAAEQIAAFASADMVVGPSGAGMFNTVFCRPGTQVIDLESEPHWIHAHTCLFASRGLRYGIIEGLVDATDPRPVQRRWKVNVDAVCERILAFGPDRARTPARPPRREGTLDLVTPDSAHGWARIEGADKPATLEVSIDGTMVGQVLADRPRADLAALGDCAFVFRFPADRTPAPSGAEVAVRFGEGGRDLVHSPRIVGERE